MTDQELLLILQSAKPEKGLRKLYDYYPTVKRFITRNGGNASDAEDVFQEALLSLMEKVQSSWDK